MQNFKKSTEQRGFNNLIDALVKGEKLSNAADRMADLIKACPFHDAAPWKKLDQTIRFMLCNRRVPSDLSSLNNLLGAYLENHPMEVPDTSYDIAAFCFFYPNVIRDGSYDLSALMHSETCRVLLWLAAGDEPWEARNIYQDNIPR